MSVRLSDDQIRGQRFVADNRKGGLGECQKVHTEYRVGFQTLRMLKAGVADSKCFIWDWDGLSVDGHCTVELVCGTAHRGVGSKSRPAPPPSFVVPQTTVVAEFKHYRWEETQAKIQGVWTEAPRRETLRRYFRRQQKRWGRQMRR